MTTPPLRRPESTPGLAPTLVLLLGFAVLSLLTTAQGVVARGASGERGDVLAVVGVSMAAWIGWLALAPAIRWLARRAPVTRRTWWWALPTHLLAMMACHVGTTLLLLWGTRLLFPMPETPSWADVLRLLVGSTRQSLAVAIYVGIVVLDRMVATREALRARELQASRLEALASRARLDALAARLAPHFLFNALQSVSALVASDPPRARTMLAQLGDLLRDALDTTSAGTITLAEEMALLDRYLAIERTRFADRLAATVAVAPEVAGAAVPRFLLQPVVENALRHGLAPLPEGGRLTVHATRHRTGVQVRVWNSGVSVPGDVVDGVGLATTRARLQEQFGAAATLTLRRAAEGGTEACLTFPG